jgi:hypothetical protein
MNFLKVVAFKVTIIKLLNTLAVHINIKGLPPYAYLTRFFRINVPLNHLPLTMNQGLRLF